MESWAPCRLLAKLPPISLGLEEVYKKFVTVSDSPSGVSASVCHARSSTQFSARVQRWRTSDMPAGVGTRMKRSAWNAKYGLKGTYLHRDLGGEVGFEGMFPLLFSSHTGYSIRSCNDRLIWSYISPAVENEDNRRLNGIRLQVLSSHGRG